MKKIKEHQSLIIKILFVILSIGWSFSSVLYIIKNKSIFGFNTYYNFFINDNFNKTISTLIYLAILIGLVVLYIMFIKKKNIFKDIKELLIYVGIVSMIFLIMLPWTSSDIFYYMGVGELHSVYGQNPYYTTMKQYYEAEKENINDEIMEQGAHNFWADTTVVYGPIAQLIFSVLTKISFKNINLCLFWFKLLNVIAHVMNCFLIYKITKKLKLAIIYGLNPFIMLEFIGMVHNDIILVFLVLLSLYFLLKKKNILLSILFLAIATGIKYFTVLLLPVFVIYHIRKEEKISKRFLKCFQYGIIFIIIFLIEYILFFKDFTVLTAMFAQTGRYCKSIYSALMTFNVPKLSSYAILGRNVMFMIFAALYVMFCIRLITTKNIKFRNFIRDYNLYIFLFLMTLSNFQQWYLIWPMVTFMWQRPKIIKSTVAVSLISEFANSIYMFKAEEWKYDIYFVGYIILLFSIWLLINWNKNKKNPHIKEM